MKKANTTLIHRRMKHFVEFIAPERDIDAGVQTYVKAIESCIRSRATAHGLTVASVQAAGSYAKRTGLRRHMTGGSEVEGQDVDIAIILENRNRKGEPITYSLVPDFKRFLIDQKGLWEPHQVDLTKSSAMLALKNQKFRFDVVPIIKTKDPVIQRLIRTTREAYTTSVQGHINFVKELNGKGKHIHFNNGLRLVKWWRYHQQLSSPYLNNSPTGKKVPSFLLDLLCARAYKDIHPRKETYPEMIYEWFKHLHLVCDQRQTVHFMEKGRSRKASDAPWQVIDPKDPNNNVVANWQDFQIRELARWFEHGRDCMIRAIHHDMSGNQDASLQCLTEVFGPSFKTQCRTVQ